MNIPGNDLNGSFGNGGIANDILEILLKIDGDVTYSLLIIDLFAASSRRFFLASTSSTSEFKSSFSDIFNFCFPVINHSLLCV